MCAQQLWYPMMPYLGYKIQFGFGYVWLKRLYTVPIVPLRNGNFNWDDDGSCIRIWVINLPTVWMFTSMMSWVVGRGEAEGWWRCQILKWQAVWIEHRTQWNCWPTSSILTMVHFIHGILKPYDLPIWYSIGRADVRYLTTQIFCGTCFKHDYSDYVLLSSIVIIWGGS